MRMSCQSIPCSENIKILYFKFCITNIAVNALSEQSRCIFTAIITVNQHCISKRGPSTPFFLVQSGQCSHHQDNGLAHWWLDKTWCRIIYAAVTLALFSYPAVVLPRCCPCCKKKRKKNQSESCTLRVCFCVGAVREGNCTPLDGCVRFDYSTVAVFCCSLKYAALIVGQQKVWSSLLLLIHWGNLYEPND